MMLSTAASKKGELGLQTGYARLDLGGRLGKGLVKFVLTTDLGLTTIKLRHLSNHVLSFIQGLVDGVSLHVNVLK